jgi:hypothetical protein
MITLAEIQANNFRLPGVTSVTTAVQSGIITIAETAEILDLPVSRIAQYVEGRPIPYRIDQRFLSALEVNGFCWFTSHIREHHTRHSWLHRVSAWLMYWATR